MKVTVCWHFAEWNESWHHVLLFPFPTMSWRDSSASLWTDWLAAAITFQSAPPQLTNKQCAPLIDQSPNWPINNVIEPAPTHQNLSPQTKNSIDLSKFVLIGFSDLWLTMSDYFWIIWLRTGDTSILSQQLRRCIFERSEEIERVNLMALGSGRINEASPQLWFSRNVSIGDSPTATTIFCQFPASRVKPLLKGGLCLIWSLMTSVCAALDNARIWNHFSR